MGMRVKMRAKKTGQVGEVGLAEEMVEGWVAWWTSMSRGNRYKPT